MGAAILTLCDAIKTELNDAELSLTFTAIRTYRPRWTLQDLAKLRVAVVPMAVQAVFGEGTRERQLYRYQLGIPLQKKFGSEANTELDAYVDLVEEIIDQFRAGRSLDDQAFVCKQVEAEPLFFPEHLDQDRVFTSVVQMLWETWR